MILLYASHYNTKTKADDSKKQVRGVEKRQPIKKNALLVEKKPYLQMHLLAERLVFFG
jgi:hypothetical protein